MNTDLCGGKTIKLYNTNVIPSIKLLCNKYTYLENEIKSNNHFDVDSV